jgi:hypothetical protein
MFYENPYRDDPFIDSCITVTKPRVRRCHEVTCAVCGRALYVYGQHNVSRALKAFVRHGWHQTSVHGWVCPKHYKGKARGYKIGRAIKKRERILEDALNSLR